MKGMYFLSMFVATFSFSQIQPKQALSTDSATQVQNLSIKKNTGSEVTSTNPVEIIEDIKHVKSWADLVGMQEAILTFLITLGGYLAYFIPGIKNISNTTYRVLVLAVLIVAGAVVLGFANIWQGVLSYLISTGLYVVVLKWFVKTPKPTPAVG